MCADEAELTDIDSRFGDADHGYTMTKICNAMESAIDASEGNIKEMLDEAAIAVDEINGGSAVPLWNTWLDGLQEGAPEADQMSEEELKSMFQTAFEAIDDFSGAKVGDKTMMDALIPATEAIENTGGSSDEIFAQAAKAAEKGAEATKEFASKFGRAKSYGKKTIGTPDAGALSMAKFFIGLSKT
ncbi:MAG: DAK2 domain-containing protein [Lachnospiraceae bacterium]|nr:DAK2 domain-containing protein [Lachnospiraceae bacterium]